MSDRNTTVRASQIRNLTLTGEDIANTSISGSTKLIDGSVPEVKLDIDNSPTNGYILSWNDAAGKMKWQISSTTDHGTLAGLDDDDHSQYLLTNGNRQLTGTWNFGSQTISGTGDFYTTGSIGAGINPLVKFHAYGAGELFRLQDTSASGNPYMSFYQDSTRKAYIQYADSGDQFVFDSDGLIQFNTSNSNAVTIDASGNVGIGTDSPSYNLDLVKPTATARITSTTAGEDAGLFLWKEGTKYFKLKIEGSDDSFRINTGAFGDALTIAQTTGNVGIGTTSPLTKLSLESGSTYADGIHLGTQNAAVGFDIWYNNSGQTSAYIESRYDQDLAAIYFRMKANGTPVDAMAIRGTGNVGFGTTNPQKEVHISSSSPCFRLERIGTGAGYWDTIISHSGASTYGSMFITPSVDTGDFILRDSSQNEVLYVDTSEGNVGIGTGSPSYPLDVENNRASNYVMRIYNAGDDANRYGMAIQAGANDGSGTTYYVLAKDGNGTETGQIKTVNGVFTLADTSDERLKCNIEDAQINGIETISGLRVKRFNWNKNPNGPKVTGLVAQEVQGVYPEAVSASDDGILSISKEFLIMPLVKAVQELIEENKELKARIEALEK